MAWKRPQRPVVIKKYGNRRLYDTKQSRYVTQAELAELIQGGTDVRVVDAKSGEDLTQATLMQIILDGRGAAELLPIELLTQLVRMGDDSLAEFLGRYMSYALEMYVHAKQGAQALAPFNPFAALPFAAANNLARMWQSGAPNESKTAGSLALQQDPPDDVAALREELETLRAEVASATDKKRPRKPKKSREHHSDPEPGEPAASDADPVE